MSAHVWGSASGVLFLEGRVSFLGADGVRAKANAGAPSCLVAYGARNVRALEESGLPGKVVVL